MKRSANARFFAFTGLLAFALLAPQRVSAHCDGMDGPVVKAAQQALATGNVNLVLFWIQGKDVPELRKAFAKTQAVRKLNPEARELADLYFFETVVRIHRAGEGEPYAGLGEFADAIRGYAAGEPPALNNLVKSLRALVALYPSHIWKEDYLLFPLAGKVLTPEDQQDEVADRVGYPESILRSRRDENAILRAVIEQLELAVAS